MTPDRGPISPRLFLCSGARATEQVVLRDLATRIDETREQPAALARPLRVIVPSRSLRLHLTTRLLDRRSRALAGVVIQTHFAVALEILERGELPIPRGRFLFEPLPRRFARDERSLQDPLERLDDGFAAVVATVRDLLDAGFEPALAAGLDEALAAEGRGVATGAQVERARALVRVARRVWQEMADSGIGHASRLLDLAAQALRDHGDAVLPARAILVHGFSDATGRVTDLLEALQDVCGAQVYLDRPPDSGNPQAPPERLRADPTGETFGARFVERMQLAAAPERLDAPPLPTPEISTFTARGTEAEVRETVRRVGSLLDGGTRPDAVALVARDLAPYRRELRRTLTHLGVPFSGVGERGSITPGGRHSEAVLDLLRRRGETAADRFLDTLAFVPRKSDLRLALYALGTGRLRDLARLDVAAVTRNGRYLLPLRQGFRGAPVDDGDGEGDDDARPIRSSRRSISADDLERLRDLARRALDVLNDWPRGAPVEGHLHRLGRLLTDALGWKPEASEIQPLHIARERLAAEAPRELGLALDELLPLLARAAEPEGRDPLGGAGGGIAVLSVTEARGRTFEHLFLLGLNRDVFPRTVHEDPLLPDTLRAQLRHLLPDLPIKAVGHDEERFLFDQLLSSADHVTLSWQTADEDGQVRAASPLVDRVLRSPGLADRESPEAPSPWSLGSPALPGSPGSPGPGGPPSEGSESPPPVQDASPSEQLGLRASEGGPPGLEAATRAPISTTDPGVGSSPSPAPLRSASEHAILTALHAPAEDARSRFARLFPLAIRESRDALGPPGDVLGLDSLAVASARLRALQELDPDLATPEGRRTRARLGAFFGFLGATGDAEDPRTDRLSVTLLERLATCPWQVFLERILGVEPTPDPLTLPGVDPRLLGTMVHEVLDAVVRNAAPAPAEADGSLDEVRSRPPFPAPWPTADELEEMLHAAARRVLADEGLHLPGFVRVLVEQSRPHLNVAREMDWRRGASLSVLGSEVWGELEIEDAGGRLRPVRFRADRADAAQGGVVLTDYKTGKPFTEHKTEPTRRRKLLEQVAAGRRLQAPAYALAAGSGGRGRYLFLQPGVEPEHRNVPVTASDAEVLEAFAAAARTALAVWDEGAFFPRLLDPRGRETPPACRWCAVRQACLQGDSGAGLRLFEVLDRGDSPSPALQGAWPLPLGETPEENGDDEEDAS